MSSATRLVKAALFLCTGIVLHRLGSVNETWLHGRGRQLRVAGVVFTVAALGLADLPPFATYLGKGYIEASAQAHGMVWVTAAMVLSSVVVGGAVLRVAGGVFFGLGDPPAEDPEMAEESSEETSETEAAHARTPLSMILPPIVLLVVAATVTFVPSLGRLVQDGAVRLEDQVGYAATVLDGARVAHPVALHVSEPTAVTLADVATGAGSAAGAVVLAGVSLYRRRLNWWRARPDSSPLAATAMRRVQSGVVADYLTWLVIGTACLGGALAWSLR